MHTITTRPATSDELKTIEQHTKFDFASPGCLLVVGVWTAYALGKVGGWLGGFFSQQLASYGQWTGWLLAASFFGTMFLSIIPISRRERQRALLDWKDKIVQDIQVVEAPVIEIGPIGNIEPILAFSIGENKILYLQGQWLCDCETYGAPLPEDDAGDECVNGLPAPFSFPSSEFTISRVPHSGRILGIRVRGQYVAPQAVVEALKKEYEFCDSELLDGSLDDIANILARVHADRTFQRSDKRI